MNAGLEAAHRAQIQRKEIEEQSSFRLRGQRNHLAFLLLGGLLIDVLQVGGFAAQSGPVVHDLAIYFTGCKVNETQRLSSGLAGRHSNLCEIGPAAKLGWYCWFYTTERGITGITVVTHLARNRVQNDFNGPRAALDSSRRARTL